MLLPECQLLGKGSSRFAGEAVLMKYREYSGNWTGLVPGYQLAINMIDQDILM
jgi:hypothetical protein